MTSMTSEMISTTFEAMRQPIAPSATTLTATHDSEEQGQRAPNCFCKLDRK